MNEELQSKLIEYLAKIEGGIEKAVDFSAEQAPLVIQELIQWAIVEHTIYAAVFGILVLLCLVAAFVCVIKRKQMCPNDPAIPVALGSGISLAVGTAMLNGVFINGSVALKAYLVPRLFVLEYLKDLVN